MKPEILFAYSLLDARTIPITTVMVTSGGKNKASFFVSENSNRKRFDVLKSTYAIEIDDWAVDVIRDLVEDKDLYAIKMVETKGVTNSDYINRFYFSDGINKNEICGVNLGKRKSFLETSYKDVMRLTDLLGEMEDILVPQGVDPRCFSLEEAW